MYPLTTVPNYMFMYIFDFLTAYKACFALGLELVQIAKTGGYKLLPYDIYGFAHERKKLKNNFFNIDAIMRPACFIPTTDSLAKFESMCTVTTTDFLLLSEMRFWCFPYSYCDRSNWNKISADSKAFIDESHNRKHIMARTVLIEEGLVGDDNDDNEYDDDSGSEDSSDRGLDDDVE